MTASDRQDDVVVIGLIGFVFERVAVGSHSIDVIPDNLPLPWFIDEAHARQRIQVDVRGETSVDIGAERSR